MSRLLSNRRLREPLMFGLLVASLLTLPHPLAAAQESRIGLDGYCPVCILDGKKWVAGLAEHEVQYDGVRYRFPDRGAKEKFLGAPARYVPALGGDCTVCLAKAGKRVAGSPQHAVLHRNRLYLFPGAKEKEMFIAKPADFENVDLALNGECLVCRAMANKRVAGKPEFAAVHQGMRYWFPSEKERSMFVADPAKFVAAQRPQAARRPQGAAIEFTATGKTGCAACEHGVHPIGSPDQLGLAVNTSEGRVIVVEDAHRKYPELYKARFDGKRVKVTGQVIRQNGKVSWLTPRSLEVIN